MLCDIALFVMQGNKKKQFSHDKVIKFKPMNIR